jgi:hypothetical protein
MTHYDLHKLPAPAGHQQWYTASRHTGITAKCPQRPGRPKTRETTAGRRRAAQAAANTIADTLVIPV